MGLVAEWKAARERRRQAQDFLRRLHQPGQAADVAWLAALCGDPSVAARELEFARRAIGLTAAGRDALDDRTASEVAKAMAPMLEAESRRQSPESGDRWAPRWRAYCEALAARGVSEPPAARFAKVMLGGAGVQDPSAQALAQATEVIQVIRGHANEALRASFGAAALPEDVRPSAIRS